MLCYKGKTQIDTRWHNDYQFETNPTLKSCFVVWKFGQVKPRTCTARLYAKQIRWPCKWHGSPLKMGRNKRRHTVHNALCSHCVPCVSCPIFVPLYVFRSRCTQANLAKFPTFRHINCEYSCFTVAIAEEPYFLRCKMLYRTLQDNDTAQWCRNICRGFFLLSNAWVNMCSLPLLLLSLLYQNYAANNLNIYTRASQACQMVVHLRSFVAHHY